MTLAETRMPTTAMAFTERMGVPLKKINHL